MVMPRPMAFGVQPAEPAAFDNREDFQRIINLLLISGFLVRRLPHREVIMDKSLQGKIHLEFECAPTTSLMELSLYIQYFLSTYRAIDLSGSYREEDSNSISPPVEGLFSKLTIPQMKKCLDNSPKSGDPQILSINQQSPLIITICGCLLLLTSAAVLSGGSQEIKIGPLEFKFNLRSLGESLKILQSSFIPDKSFQPVYCLPGQKIKLNQSEFNELMKSANSNGGFQLFQQELQRRINQKTKILVLTEEDVRRILRYKLNPKKGGFQSRYQKIFGRHFR